MDAMVVSGAIACLSLSSVGSAIGTGLAAASAVGSWKKCYAAGKPAPFTLLTFVGLPLSQTLYGMILMFVMVGKTAIAGAGLAMLLLGLFAGLGIGASAVFQGRAAAAACDAQAETGQGLANYVIALGVVETVAIFVMVFTIIALGKIV
ncbi:MAG: V-type ATP synthase subunit K [Kiritimatiellae bacterium]|nr:V-type ATP synthase subunit K [Kiritimatiellia bacterium]